MAELNGRWIPGLLALACALGATTASLAQQRELRVISDRTDQGTLRPILDAFEARSGAKVVGVFMDQGLVNRLESRPTEADVVITKDAELIELAKRKGLLAKLESAPIEKAVPAPFRSISAGFPAPAIFRFSCGLALLLCCAAVQKDARNRAENNRFFGAVTDTAALALPTRSNCRESNWRPGMAIDSADRNHRDARRARRWWRTCRTRPCPTAPSSACRTCSPPTWPASAW